MHSTLFDGYSVPLGIMGTRPAILFAHASLYSFGLRRIQANSTVALPSPAIGSLCCLKRGKNFACICYQVGGGDGRHIVLTRENARDPMTMGPLIHLTFLKSSSEACVCWRYVLPGIFLIQTEYNKEQICNPDSKEKGGSI